MAEGDVNLLSVPLSHNTGFTTAAAGLLLGHHLVVMPRFDAHEFLRLVTEHRVTYLATVPTVMQRLLPVYRADPDAYDLSSIRRFWHLGAPCPPAIKLAWIDILGAEKRLGTVRRHRTSGADLHLRRPVPDASRIGGRRRRRRDEGARRRRQRMRARRRRRDLHAAQPRAARRPTATSGRRPRAATGGTRSATSATSTPTAFLYLNDRRVDMFTVGGRNVYPAEIEAALAEHPDDVVLLGRWRA